MAEFVKDSVQSQAAPDVFFRTLQALRFYEQEGAIPHLLQVLEQPLQERDDVVRACYVLQAAADIGMPSDTLKTRIVDFLDGVVIPNEQIPALWALLMETRLVLAPYGADTALVERLDQEVSRAERDEMSSEAGMMAFDKVAAVRRNDLPRHQGRAKMKADVLAEPNADERRQRLVELYLGRLYGGTVLEDWAGRQLRREAISEDPAAVHQALADGIDRIDHERAVPAQADKELVRAAQAVLYLGGRLSAPHRESYSAARGVANFLWDDL
ncbi:hypothetical protein ACFLU6_01840 [Acidobacteriota bacterium]